MLQNTRNTRWVFGSNLARSFANRLYLNEHLCSADEREQRRKTVFVRERSIFSRHLESLPVVSIIHNLGIIKRTTLLHILFQIPRKRQSVTSQKFRRSPSYEFYVPASRPSVDEKVVLQTRDLSGRTPKGFEAGWKELWRRWPLFISCQNTSLKSQRASWEASRWWRVTRASAYSRLTCFKWSTRACSALHSHGPAAHGRLRRFSFSLLQSPLLKDSPPVLWQ